MTTKKINYWLFKSEPDAFSINDLKNKKISCWDGVRNYQARNFLRDQVKLGDLVIFYHSSCKEVGAAGICEVVKEAYPDHTAFDPNSKYFDAKSKIEKPQWYMVDVKWLASFKHTILLSDMREVAALADMTLMKKGNRLSLFPITKTHFNQILKMADYKM
jgi:predicted RNA-binding protein with PUA-like domain